MVHCSKWVNLRSTGAKMDVCTGGSVRRWWWRCRSVLTNVVQMWCWSRCVKLQLLVRVSSPLARGGSVLLAIHFQVQVREWHWCGGFCCC
ncbi:hypothetical protein DEO72_LG2g5399 [Vigna unguiculata]|uniref:Uncharacterized protein n=1 Tax=Vigna unguiculata TaxID=3917 RepID=A0A4D6L938_VIGUN|nr:hypothetical protein DEO72_LG2g5399 [Vigna unguiculata]